MTIGEFIKQKRKEQGLSSNDVARYLKVSPAYIYAVENGVKTVPILRFLQVMAILAVDPSDFIKTLWLEEKEKVRKELAHYDD